MPPTKVVFDSAMDLDPISRDRVVRDTLCGSAVVVVVAVVVKVVVPTVFNDVAQTCDAFESHGGGDASRSRTSASRS